MVTQYNKEYRKDGKAELIEAEIKNFVKTSPKNHLTVIDDKLFDEPIVQYAGGDDPLFEDYKTIIDSSHLTPREALAKSFYKDYEQILNGTISVISWVLPASKVVRDSNRSEILTPSRIYMDYYALGEPFNCAVREHVIEILTGMGYKATAPATQTYFKFRDFSPKIGLYSNWSERHIAYAAGLGTFSLSDGFITEKGISHRCGSVITNLKLPASPRTAENMHSNCLFYANGSCKACINRCPGKAISEKGHDKLKCFDHMQIDLNFLKEKYHLNATGCALCQTGVPCEFVNPAKGLKSR